MAGYTNLILVFDGPVAQLTINRPGALNALNSEVLAELGDALDDVSSSQARGLIITGAGEKAFVAGADIGQMAGFTVEEAYAFARQGHAVLAAIESMPIPVVAAVNGFALGGGCELAMACDLIYASEKARFGQPEVKLGVIPGFGGTQRLSRLVGTQMARELVFTGRMIDANDALRIGLVAKVTAPDELLKACQDVLLEITRVGPLAVAAAKRVILDGFDRPLGEAGDLEARAFADLFASQDQTEGMEAFQNKRKPEFKGA